MKANIGKGTDMFLFLGDMFKFFGDFWVAETSDSYWEELKNASEELLRKYQKCDFFELAKAIVLAYNVYMSDVKLKGNPKGHWQMSFKAD